MSNAGDFAAIAVALYAAHHVGDYWVQRDVDARHKGDPGTDGRLHCLAHVITYVATQTLFLFVTVLAAGVHASAAGYTVGLLVSGVTHYIADRREPLKRIAAWIPGKSEFVKLGMPRSDVEIDQFGESCSSCQGTGTSWDASTGGKCWDCRGTGKDAPRTVGDNLQLATGLWALDQSWHIFWGVFVTALVMVSL